jgi:outer membrane murein-binding lipoprotein Lpp
MIESSAVWTIIGVNVGLIALLATLMVVMINKLDSDIKGISARVDGLTSRMDAHASRIDQLYKMFVELVKEKK